MKSTVSIYGLIFIIFVWGLLGTTDNNRELQQHGSKEQRDWFQSVDKAVGRTETETERKREKEAG